MPSVQGAGPVRGKIDSQVPTQYRAVDNVLTVTAKKGKNSRILTTNETDSELPLRMVRLFCYGSSRGQRTSILFKKGARVSTNQNRSPEGGFPWNLKETSGDDAFQTDGIPVNHTTCNILHIHYKSHP